MLKSLHSLWRQSRSIVSYHGLVAELTAAKGWRQTGRGLHAKELTSRSGDPRAHIQAAGLRALHVYIYNLYPTFTVTITS